jgi:hypothetical protein
MGLISKLGPSMVSYLKSEGRIEKTKTKTKIRGFPR